MVLCIPQYKISTFCNGSNRFKMEKLFVEKPGVFDVSSARKVLASLV